MRLALRFAAAVTLGIGLVLAVQAALHVERIARLQESEIEDDMLTLGRVLAHAVGRVWAVEGDAASAEFVARADERRERTRIRLIRGDRLQETQDHPSRTRVERIYTDGSWRIVALAPVRHEGQMVGVIEIERELPNERDYWDSVLLTQVATTLFAAAVSGALALALGVWIIGRPIRKLSEQARKVAEGDFSSRSEVTQSDEIGDLAREFDAMTDRLEETRDEIRAERRARTESLEKLRHADRLSTVGRLASSMAHELGTPLNVIAARSTMIASEENVTAEAQANARIISEQAQRMTGIIREILNFARRKTLETAEVPIGEVLDHATALLEPILDDKSVSVDILGVRDAALPIDSGKILQVLTNLMMNAIHAMPNGGTIKLRVRREHVVDPPDRHACGGDFVVVTVEDEGIGIAEDQLDTIFRDFFTTKEEGTGTGLGLGVCQGIVREHGGWIDVESEIGSGTRLIVYLPEKEES